MCFVWGKGLTSLICFLGFLFSLSVSCLLRAVYMLYVSVVAVAAAAAAADVL